MTSRGTRTPLKVRFRRKYKLNAKTGCWDWTGAKNGHGYGYIRDEDANCTTLQAHRVSYEMHVGPIPDGLQIDHLCRNRLCVNPKHLEPVTAQVNTMRAKAIITHCPQGHPYDEENTMLAYGHLRACRICKRAMYQRWYHERGGKAYRAAQRAVLVAAVVVSTYWPFGALAHNEWQWIQDGGYKSAQGTSCCTTDCQRGGIANVHANPDGSVDFDGTMNGKTYRLHAPAASVHMSPNPDAWFCALGSDLDNNSARCLFLPGSV